jgi:hypothetical protein
MRSVNSRIAVQASLDIKGDLIPKTIWAGGVAQVVEHLPIKHKALSSNPSGAKEEGVVSFLCAETQVSRVLLAFFTC